MEYFFNLDALVGTWSEAEAAEFAAAIAPLGEIELDLWTMEPGTTWGGKPAAS
jgi:hypothetical protein